MEINRIVKQFEALQHGDCWIGVNFKEALHGMKAYDAANAVAANGNSFWQLVNHIVYWRTAVVNRLTGSLNPPPFTDFSLPGEITEAAWKQTLLDFEAAYHALRHALHQIKDEQLDKPTVRPEQNYHQLILGCLQHDAYHLGQMVLLKNKR